MTTTPTRYTNTLRLHRSYRSTFKTLATGAFLAFLFMVPVVTGMAIYANAPKPLPDHSEMTDADTYAPTDEEPPVTNAAAETP